MDNIYSQPQPMASQYRFFQYHPEVDPQHRQYGHFMPHPNEPLPYLAKAMPVHAYHTGPSMGYPTQTPCQQPMPVYAPAPFQSPMAFGGPAVMTPQSSPQQMHFGTPEIVVDHTSPALQHLDMSFVSDRFHSPSPSTPSLSASSSTASSPPSSCCFSTPIDADFLLPVDNVGVMKRGLEADVNDVMAAEWSRCGTPEMTPGRRRSPLTRNLDLSWILGILCDCCVDVCG